MAKQKTEAKVGRQISSTKERVIRFKEPGGSVTIGNQRFDQASITPATYDGLVAMNPDFAKLFEVSEREHSSHEEAGAEEAAEGSAG